MRPALLALLLLPALSSCSQAWCNAAPLCLAPGSAVGNVSLRQQGPPPQLHPGEAALVKFVVTQGAVPVGTPLQWGKVDAAAQANSDVRLLAVPLPGVTVTAAANPALPAADGTVAVYLSAAPWASVGQVSGLYLTLTRSDQGTVTPGSGALAFSVAP